MSRRIANVLNIAPRYLRATNIERDFADPNALENYVLTSHTRNCLERIARGLRRGATDRAWRLTGNYGSGKSSFALLAARWFSGDAKRLVGKVQGNVSYESFSCEGRPKIQPVLVTGSREPMANAILRALAKMMVENYTRGQRSEVLCKIIRAADGELTFNDADVVRWVQWCNGKLVKDGKAKGILLLLDELGKFLEFAAFHPSQQDVFLLQRLAEAAASSGDTPFFIVGLLHQGFSAYADNLDPVAQREWEKTAGRFEEIVFDQPLLQISQLVASALQVNERQLPRDVKAEALAGMESALSLGWLGGAPRRDELVSLAYRVYPLHATVLPALVRVFRRFGQNERSLFSFLLSNEPFGLQKFADRALASGNSYRIPDFYDYVRANFGYRLSLQSYRSHWTQIESMIESFAAADELDRQILKTVGVLNLLDANDLLPTGKAVIAALGGPGGADENRIQQKIEHFCRSNHALFRRGVSGALCLWPHTSADLEAAYDQAVKAVGGVQRIGNYLREILEVRPIVARRHYIQSGNLRYFEVAYCPVVDLENNAVPDIDADGKIVVALCETEDEIATAERFALSGSVAARHNLLVAIPDVPLINHAGLVAESMRWDWVLTNTPALNGDRYAREEVSRQRAGARLFLERRVVDLFGLRSFSGNMALRWYRAGQREAITSARQLLAKVSDYCDAVYSQAPVLRNELINRRVLGSQAAAARQRLMELMFAETDKPLFGMDANKRPPEMSMYLSLFKAGGLHVQVGTKARLVYPKGSDDKLRLAPVFEALSSRLARAGDARIGCDEILRMMADPPFGIRAGPAVLLLALFVAHHRNEVALYESGTFLQSANGGDFMRLAKVPESFALQLCRLEGIRSDIFEHLLDILQLPGDRRFAHILDVVSPLCLYMARLPEYGRNTRRLPTQALAVRDAILSSKEPIKILFHQLPIACEMPPIPADVSTSLSVGKEFAARLRRAIDQIRGAYSSLLARMRMKICESFNLTGEFLQVRQTLANRAVPLVVLATEPKLKSFCLRLADAKLDDEAWLESLGSLLTLQPPSRWRDLDEDAFVRDLGSIATRFGNLESIAFATGSRPAAEAYRLSLTRNDGNESQEVVYVEAEDHWKVVELTQQLHRLLGDNHRLGMAALSRFVWNESQRKVTK
jgi:hypothetical protein